MNSSIKKNIVKDILFLLFLCLSIFLLTGKAVARGGMGGTDPAIITPAGGSLTPGETGTLYGPETITASGCDGNYEWTLTSGSLPQGLSFSGWFNQSITISGTPEVVENASFTLQVVGEGCLEKSETFSLNIVLGNNPVISTASLLYGLVGTAYSDTITGDLGTTDYGWSVTIGALPDGLSLFDSNGVPYIDGLPNPLTTPSVTLAGTPTTAGTYIFTVMLTDSAGNTDSKEFRIDIDANIQITSYSPLPDGTEGIPYSFTFAGIGGSSSSYAWSILEEADPDFLAGLAINEQTGELSGVPTAEGDYVFTVVLTDGTNVVTRDYELKIYPSDLAFDTNVIPPAGTACTYYSANIAGIGGAQPYSWGIAAGNLPPGLIITSTGTPSTLISGTPTEAGIFTFTVILSDSYSITKTRSFVIEITGDPSGCVVNMDENTAYPPFIATSVTPNVLLILDNSVSMYEFAYKDAGTSQKRSKRDTSYTTGVEYYGYFECDKSGLITYTYNASGYFERTDAAVTPLNSLVGTGDTFNGCFLNWLTMRRVDVARKVLVGGKVDTIDTSGIYLVATENPNRNTWKGYDGHTFRVKGYGGDYEVIRTCQDNE